MIQFLEEGDKMKVVMASDKSGFVLKEAIKDYLLTLDYEVIDKSADGPLDYYVAGYKAGKEVSENSDYMGVIFCGNGYGVAEAARSFKNNRVVNASNPTSAKSARIVNNANIISMGGNIVAVNVAKDIVDNFLNTKFAQGLPAETKAYLEASFNELEKMKEEES